ncbi:MAG: hypothetical protein QME47_04040 [Candidatus Thermoplasmatota archaeon]|nr:hypothetical protein [Candidatus Thermoplasmatota archaeon]
MAEKIIDKRKWERYTGYLDVIIFLVLIGCIVLIIKSSIDYGFYHSEYVAGDETALNMMGAAQWGLMGSLALTALVIFWIFYRYFKLRVERRAGL